jgi:hypothetical protein
MESSEICPTIFHRQSNANWAVNNQIASNSVNQISKISSIDPTLRMWANWPGKEKICNMVIMANRRIIENRA